MKTDAGVALIASDGTRIDGFDTVIWAVGRAPNTRDLALDRAGLGRAVMLTLKLQSAVIPSTSVTVTVARWAPTERPAVPKENEGCNQTWISDRDRFSYSGIYSEDRLRRPMVRDNGSLREADWDEALQIARRAKDEKPRLANDLIARINERKREIERS